MQTGYILSHTIFTLGEDLQADKKAFTYAGKEPSIEPSFSVLLPGNDPGQVLRDKPAMKAGPGEVSGTLLS